MPVTVRFVVHCSHETDGSEDTRRGPVSTEITLDPRRVMAIVLVACIGAELAFVFLDYHVNYGRLVDIGAIRRLFNIAREDGLASWFGTAQTMLVALTLWALYAIARVRRRPGCGGPAGSCWRSCSPG